MLSETAAVRTYFDKLGLEAEIADLYMALHTHGPQTISELSRSSGVERTRIYRLIDALLASSLVEVESHHKRGIIKAAPIANLRILISRKEQELHALQDELGLIEQVLARNSISSPAVRVQLYQGQAGAQQMHWNQTQSKTEVLSILHQNAPFKSDSVFFNRWIQAANEHGLSFRTLVNSASGAWDEWHSTSKSTLKNWEARSISDTVFSVAHSTVIYGNVVAHYIWKDGEIFGTEIYNLEIANAQRQLFEMLWEQSQA